MTLELSLSLILDVTIIVLLLATIVYAVRLSLYLKKFKDSRSELESVIKDLSSHINKADKAVKSLNDTVEISSEDLQARMDKANAMFDELDIVVQSGDALANRLEQLASRNRKIMEGDEGDMADLASHSRKAGREYDERLEQVVKSVKESDNAAASNAKPFMIRDRDVDRDDNQGAEGFTLDDNDMLSDAERDLYDALKNNKKKKGA